MKLPVNAFEQALADRRRQIGLWSNLCSSVSAEIIAPAGFDWVLIDMEHSPNSLQSVMSQLQVYAGSDTTAIVRPPWNDFVMIKRLLDIGAPGLLFPMIQSVAEAKAAVAATRYPPKGIRGVSGATRANKFGRITDYFQEIEKQTSVLVQLETRVALEQAEEIAAIDGISGVFFGPADIAADIEQASREFCIHHQTANGYAALD
ncbi:MAG: aldolase/citrate lyase family protein [Pseudomonadota bacterium]